MQTKKIFFAAGFLLTHCLLPVTNSSAQGTWVQKNNFPGAASATSVGFAIGNKGYYGLGFIQNNPATVSTDEWWEYDPATDSWTQKANFPGGLRMCAIGIAIGSKGYVGAGSPDPYNTTVYDDWWEYDPIANTWIQKTNIPGGPRAFGAGFAIGNKGYVGTGTPMFGPNLPDFYEYDPVTDTWTQKANFLPVVARADIDRNPFVIGNKGYWGMGNSGVNDWFEYDPVANTWTQKANYPGIGWMGCTGFSICNMGFVGLGATCALTCSSYNDLYRYDPASNSWSAMASLPGAGRVDQPAFVINNKAYVICGYDANTDVILNEVWEFTPPPSGVSATVFSSANTVCSGQPVTLTAGGGTSYSWSTGSTNNPIVVSPSATTTYSVIVSDISVCSGSDTTSITITIANTVTATISSPATICSGNTVTLTASGGTTYSWSNGQTISSITVSPTATTTYSVIAYSGSCSDTVSATVTVNLPPVIIAGNNVTLCTGTTVTLSASGGNNYSWSNGQTTSSIAVAPTTTITYTVIASDANGCTGMDSVTVVITPSIIANAGPDATICAGDNIALNASGGTGYSWIPSAGLSNPNIYNPIASPANTTTYTVIVTSGSCAPASDSVTIVVYPSPTVSAWNTVTISAGSSATLNSGSNPAAATYSWSPAAGLSCTNCQNPVASPLITTMYCVTITDISGCMDSACVTVTVVGEPVDCTPIQSPDAFDLPNAFSPNGDGQNDEFHLLYSPLLVDCVEEIYIAIYNRWGERVFEGTTINFSWDGTFRNKPENTAVFAYYLKAVLHDGTEIKKKGNISLIR